MTVRRTVVAALATALAACNPQPSANDVAPQPSAEQTPPAAPAQTPAVDPAAASAEPAVLAIEGEGLRLFNPATGAARPLPFETPQATVLTALATRGAPRTNRLDECGAGPLDTASWPDGLTLYFQEGKFVGWALGGGDDEGDVKGARSAPTTAAGIAPGSTRAELEAAYTTEIDETTLGTEFNAGELFGILEGKGKAARITTMWGGTSCNFR